MLTSQWCNSTYAAIARCTFAVVVAVVGLPQRRLLAGPRFKRFPFGGTCVRSSESTVAARSSSFRSKRCGSMDFLALLSALPRTSRAPPCFRVGHPAIQRPPHLVAVDGGHRAHDGDDQAAKDEERHGDEEHGAPTTTGTGPAGHRRRRPCANFMIWNSVSAATSTRPRSVVVGVGTTVQVGEEDGQRHAGRRPPGRPRSGAGRGRP